MVEEGPESRERRESVERESATLAMAEEFIEELDFDQAYNGTSVRHLSLVKKSSDCSAPRLP